MGARLVAWVLVRWTHVSDVEFRVLVRMAHTSLDERSGALPAATYFGGHELLMATLRQEGGSPSTVLRRVRKAITGLVEAGAIERVNAARSGANQVYRLTLEGVRKIDVDGSAPEAQQVPHDPTQQVPGEPTQQVPQGPECRSLWDLPMNQEEPLEELYEEEGDLVRTGLEVVRASCDQHPSMLGGDREDGLPICPFCRRAARSPSRPTFQIIEGGAA